MTNTLHRFGKAESFKDDFIVFGMTTKVKKDPDAVPKLKRFLSLALEFKPVNMGDSRKGGSLRPSRHLSPLAHWKRDLKPNFQAVIDGLDTPSTCAVVFDNEAAAERFVKRVKEEDLGISVNVSTSIDGARDCCKFAGIHRHSVGYSTGFEGNTERIPDATIAMITTMCGHSLIAPSLAEKMLGFVKENRRTPKQAAAVLTRFCSCGVFNPERAERILESARHGHQL